MAEAAFKLTALDAPTYRELPQNIEAEQALLGAIFINNDAFYRVADFLKPNHFFEPLHGRIFELMSDLIRANRIASPITLKTFPSRDSRHRRTICRAISRAPGRGSDDRYQRTRLWPHRLRSRGAARADQDRGGHARQRL